jgi:hypothetical protein
MDGIQLSPGRKGTVANQMGAAPMLITPHRTRTIAAAVDVVELELLAFLRGILEEVRFALDSPLEGAVTSEPVSGTGIPC